MMPARDAAPMPLKNESGTLMTRAQGQLTTRKMSAPLMLSVHDCPKSTGEANAMMAANPTTMGV